MQYILLFFLLVALKGNTQDRFAFPLTFLQHVSLDMLSETQLMLCKSMSSITSVFNWYQSVSSSPEDRAFTAANFHSEKARNLRKTVKEKNCIMSIEMFSLASIKKWGLSSFSMFLRGVFEGIQNPPQHKLGQNKEQNVIIRTLWTLWVFLAWSVIH